MLGTTTVLHEPPPKRQFPWFIDILLYPTSKAGLITMGVIIGVPIAMILLGLLLGVMAIAFPPVLILLVFFGIVGGLVNILIILFAYWYACECIRDSAAGNLRAPETVGITPGFGEIFGQILKILVCLIIFAGPAFVYSLYTDQINISYWSLLAYAIFFFPMGLLAVVWFDSFSALNPVLIIGSIFSTFLPYLGLILLYAAGTVIYILGNITQTLAVIFSPVPILTLLILPLVSGFFELYLLLIATHLLGRFYWNNQEKLRWDV